MERAKKRILRDLANLEKEPITNVTYHLPDDSNIFLGHATIKILEGKYEGLLLHLEFTFTDEFPFQPPAVRIADDFPFNSNHHKYVMKSGEICCNLTAFFEKYHRGESNAWCATSTISSVLMQLSVFFNVPETESGADSTALLEKVKSYKCKTCIHSTEVPYPPFKPRL